jgi:putative ABC transport system permease protein
VRYLPLLWAGLFRRKTRTVLTLLSVLVAFLLFGLLQAVKVAFDSGMTCAARRSTSQRCRHH